jgi:glycosyltransferase involved in cell wall biosynthesis
VIAPAPVVSDREETGTGRPLRIAVVNWGRRGLGGAESYIAGILPELRALGHELAFWSELDQPSDREPIPLPAGTREWCAEEVGLDSALAALRAWGPDLLFVHVVSRPEVEERLLEIAPAVLFAHGYLGACISGERMLKNPSPTPCTRQFGAGCLLHYHARRCGGLSPLTMIRDYRKNVRRRDLLPAYRAIIANSAHVRDVYASHVGDGTRVHALPLPVSTTDGPPAAPPVYPPAGPWRILFTGRMATLKGGRVLLEALPEVVARLGSAVHATFAGDGPDRAEWERQAKAAAARAGDRLTIEFVGWAGSRELDSIRDSSHLLVVPSLWPEPFGLVGPEAGLRGLPAVAFASGGIPDWLTDGVNGYLAPADPPTAGGLASAIVRALRDPDGYAALRRDAVRHAARFSTAAHVSALSRVFADAVGATRPAS